MGNYVYIEGTGKVDSYLSAKLIVNDLNLYDYNNPLESSSIRWYGSYDGNDFSLINELNDNWRILVNNYLPNYLKVGINEEVSSIIKIIKIDNDSIETIPLDMIKLGISLNNPIDSDNNINQVTNISRINQSLLIILSTPKGSVPMLPTLGTDLYKLQFSDVTESNLESIRLEVESVIANQEPRVKVISCDVSFDYQNTVKVSVTYSINNTNISGNFLYDFAVKDGGYDE